MRWRLWKGVVFALLPMVLAALIYLMYRDGNLIVFRLADLFGLSEGVDAMRASDWVIRNRPPGFVIYSLPGAMWLYAFSGFVMILWRGVGSIRVRRCWALVPLVVAVLSEGLQWLGSTDGTFDWQDTGAYAVAYLGVCLQMGQFTLTPEVETPVDRRLSALHGVSLGGAALFSVVIGAADAMKRFDPSSEFRRDSGGMETMPKSASNFKGPGHAEGASP